VGELGGGVGGKVGGEMGGWESGGPLANGHRDGYASLHLAGRTACPVLALQLYKLMSETKSSQIATPAELALCIYRGLYRWNGSDGR